MPGYRTGTVSGTGTATANHSVIVGEEHLRTVNGSNASLEAMTCEIVESMPMYNARQKTSEHTIYSEPAASMLVPMQVLLENGMVAMAMMPISMENERCME